MTQVRLGEPEKMKVSRREWSAVLPVLAVATVQAQSKELPVLPGKVYGSAELPNSGNEKKRGGRIFYGSTHGGFNLEMHATSLAPGVETHAPHKHEHEEIIVVLEGTLQPNVEGTQQQPADAGSVIYFGSNQTHNARNVGSKWCRYYVIELRGNNI